MKVKEIVSKIRLIDTEIVLKEGFKTVGIFKIPIKECEHLERTVYSFQPVDKNKIEIFMK